MSQVVLNEHVIRKYLLNELSEDEREQIERSMLTDDGFFSNLLALEDVVEDELIDEYLNDGLADREKRFFEQTFLSSPQRREKLELARDLNRRASSVATKPRVERMSWWRTIPGLLRIQHPLVGLPLAATLLLMTVGCVWLVFRVQRLETQLRQLTAEQRNQLPQEQNLKEQLDQQRARNEELATNLQQAEGQRTQLEQELNSLKAQNARNQEASNNRTQGQSQTSILSLTLPVLRSRGTEGEVKTVNIPFKTGNLQLSLALDAISPKDYNSYRVNITRRDGTEVWATNKVNVRAVGGANYIVVTLPTSILSDGEYNIELKGISGNNQRESIGLYSFRVLSRFP